MAADLPSIPVACCRRDNLSRRGAGATVYPGADAAIHVKFKLAWVPRLEVIGVKARCRVSASCQQCSGTTRRVVLRGDKQPWEHTRVSTRASASAGIDHVSDVINAVGPTVTTLREVDSRGYVRIGPS